ncbi:MFS transporter [Corynebacterium sp.]|uniref:MFS transporter n=1 Tax=Corynebacterium sp. TaxID=1720 RepID=UPI0028A93597|nr:MFS transporter [Corynebacterium sp.]
MPAQSLPKDRAKRDADDVGEGDSEHGWKVLQVAGIALAQTVCYYVVLVYTPTFMTADLGFESWQALLSTSIAIAGYVVTIIIAGRISDRIGRKPLLYAGGLLMLVTVIPVFILMPVAPFAVVFIAQLLLGGVALGIYTGPLVSVWTEIFPTRVRYSGVAAGFSLSVIVSVSSPFILTWLISVTDNDLMPAFYIGICVIISVLTLSKIPETAPTKTTLDNFTIQEEK